MRMSDVFCFGDPPLGQKPDPNVDVDVASSWRLILCVHMCIYFSFTRGVPECDEFLVFAVGHS